VEVNFTGISVHGSGSQEYVKLKDVALFGYTVYAFIENYTKWEKALI
jgi:hypothetical protein